MIYIGVKTIEVPIWEKYNLTIDEASAYSGIGKSKIRQMLNERGCSFLLKIGNKHLIKRKEFEKFLDGEHYL
ncbi:MAG: helix-turn-helix domain-containing protein [Lachnospiraceae bacterium]|nr:helix-turn-helix domain-containing protein [Lachnospiraceae bacterium]